MLAGCRLVGFTALQAVSMFALILVPTWLHSSFKSLPTSNNKYLFTYCSSSVRIYHHFCGSFSACTIFCASQQLGWDSIRCSKIYMWNQTCCCWESRKYWNLVSNTWHVSSIGGHNECKKIMISYKLHLILRIETL